MERGILPNLLILAGLLPAMLATFWGFVWLLNKASGKKLGPILDKIYSDPVASAIYRGAVFWACAYMVVAGFSRWV